MKGLFKGMFLWIGVFIGVFLLFNSYIQDNSNTTSEIAFSEFIKEVDNKRVSDVVIRGYKISGILSDGRSFNTYSHYQYNNLINKIVESNIRLKVLPVEGDTFWDLIIYWFPHLLFIVIWVLYMRKMQGGSGKAMGFGKSRAKLMKEKGSIRFSDVAGIDESKSELVEVVEFLKNPEDFTRLGARIPKGVLLVGPPGTGKTLLAKAVAGEAGVPFLFMSGSDFVEMFVGVGASRVRDLFDQAKKNAPCIVFIDEIDAVAKSRASSASGGHDERDQTLNQLLVEMDGFESSNHRIVFIAATNRVDILDPALMRPGRFDRKVYVSLPDVKGREEILLVHMKNIKITTDVVIRDIAKQSSGFSGADLANLVNEAAILAAVRKKKNVSMKDFEDTLDKVTMGKEKRSMVVSSNEKSITAYHEGGHALVSVLVDDNMKPVKATIIPRANGALGFVSTLPSEDQFMMTKKQLKNRICVALGGRISEEIIFGADNITTGAQSDLKSANRICKEMVLRYGMSDLGFIYNDGDVYSISEVSDELKNSIDNEIRKILEECSIVTKNLINKNIDKLHLLAKYLLEKETLDGKEIKMIVEKGKISEDPEIIEN